MTFADIIRNSIYALAPGNWRKLFRPYELAAIGALLNSLSETSSGQLTSQLEAIKGVGRINDTKLCYIHLHDRATAFAFQSCIGMEWVRVSEATLASHELSVVVDFIFENGLIAGLGFSANPVKLRSSFKTTNFQTYFDLELMPQANIWIDDSVADIHMRLHTDSINIRSPQSIQIIDWFIHRMPQSIRTNLRQVVSICDGFDLYDFEFFGTRCRRIYWPGDENLEFLLESTDAEFAMVVSNVRTGYWFLDEVDSDLEFLSMDFRESLAIFLDKVSTTRAERS